MFVKCFAQHFMMILHILFRWVVLVVRFAHNYPVIHSVTICLLGVEQIILIFVAEVIIGSLGPCWYHISIAYFL